MKEQIDWVKIFLNIIIDTKYSLDEKKLKFAALEERYREFSKAEQANVRRILKENTETDDYFYVLSYIKEFMNIEEFNNEMFDIMMNKDFSYSISTMLEIQMKTVLSFEQRKALHKKNTDLIRKELLIGTKHAYVPVKSRNRKRIVIITEQILHMNHAPTKVVINFAYVLQEILGYEIMIFACPSDAKLPKGLMCAYNFIYSVEEYEKREMIINFKNAKIFGYQISLSAENYKEYSMMLSLIYAWNPLFVFNMGVVNPVANLAGDFTTLACMAMGIECPVSEARILVRPEKIEEEVTLDKKQRQLFMDEKMPVIVEKSQNPYTKTEMGLPENKFIIAVVGNRLEKEVTVEFADVIGDICSRLPDAVFVFIGEADKIKMFFMSEKFQERIYYLGCQRDLVRAYGAADLYLNPKRAGGGFSSAMALTAGVPVVTLPNCDVAYNVGEEFIVKDYDDLKKTVCRYAEDAVFYEEKKKTAQLYEERNTYKKMEEYVEKMINGIIKLVDAEVAE